MTYIPLSGKYSNNSMAIVDDEDYKKLILIKWSLVKVTGDILYIRHNSTSMHRLIMNPPKGFMVDHINGNTLDNRKSNLRICTNAQNQWNAKTRTDKVSKYKGVEYDPTRKSPYRVKIKVDGKQKRFGSFKSEVEAAKQYDHHILILRGEWARTNFSI